MNPDDLAQRVARIEGRLDERASMRDSTVERMFRAILDGQVTTNDRLGEIEQRLGRIEESVAGFVSSWPTRQ